ncbi:sensor histidine kinase [Winogradskyella vincentii]|uniref:Histidine kinase n=1 Tax=Winogradskyella vincentii TaxID=2877122 RepID=A0ABS7Y1K3_9FLAO|nr:histidine kinase [Winogradskyella vincentii]MCA0153215.1 histidine kinase [Winogradskyella vincentii]
MKSNINTPPFNLKELFFQIALNIIVFIFFAFDRRLPGIEAHQILFYLNFAIAALIINYVLLPKFLYKNRYWHFALYSLIVIAIVIVTEEAVLEQIYYPETRGRRFLGIFYNLLSSLPTITILVGFKFAWDALIKQREVHELKNYAKESELQYLKSQINPHFLFNNINNLYAYAVEQSPKTPDLILELSSVLRYMLYDCKARFVPLNKEIEHLKNYINLSTLQIEGRGKVNITIGNIPENYNIAPLVLTVFIENAFKHSASSQTERISINSDINVSDNGILNFTCINSYQSETNVNKLDQGIGLENVKKRLDLMYPKSHKLKISDDNEYFKVQLTLDLNKTKN